MFQRMMRCGVVAKNTNTRRSSFFSFTSLTLAPVAARPPDEALERASRNVLENSFRTAVTPFYNPGSATERWIVIFNMFKFGEDGSTHS